MWQYIITFLGSLIVALASVWITQKWSARRDYKKALQNLRAEVLTNIKASSLIYQWVDKNIESLKGGELVIATCPHLYDSAWMSVRGDLVSHEYSIAEKIQELYLQVTIVNDLLQKIEDLKWGFGSATDETEQRRDLVFQATKEIIKVIVLPQLVELRNILDKKLKSKTEH